MHKVSERSALIRLASALPKGSDERKAVLASLDKTARSHRLKADMKLRNGDVLPKGTIVEVDFRKGGRNMSTVLVTAEFDGPSGHDYRRKGFQFPIGRLHDFVPGMGKPPSTGKLTRMVYDGIASTVTGKRVEPDGHGPDGSPSWLLVMGLI